MNSGQFEKFPRPFSVLCDRKNCVETYWSEIGECFFFRIKYLRRRRNPLGRNELSDYHKKILKSTKTLGERFWKYTTNRDIYFDTCY